MEEKNEILKTTLIGFVNYSANVQLDYLGKFISICEKDTSICKKIINKLKKIFNHQLGLKNNFAKVINEKCNILLFKDRFSLEEVIMHHVDKYYDDVKLYNLTIMKLEEEEVMIEIIKGLSEKQEDVFTRLRPLVIKKIKEINIETREDGTYVKLPYCEINPH